MSPDRRTDGDEYSLFLELEAAAKALNLADQKQNTLRLRCLPEELIHASCNPTEKPSASPDEHTPHARTS